MLVELRFLGCWLCGIPKVAVWFVCYVLPSVIPDNKNWIPD